ncbi:hypothetical protein [Leptolyngbya sp. FACHB-261]|uniref:hypothetical protein n=1 Tax=Leptolyngbya sp. FACHB-261 TaxID=2692806 RepID=UPI001688DC27|nr:hypothetical protein [Leptolyngbya sp. FACHB-261]MBD2104593.1 hypothetical protein [Leptolyngbya sp. FACHB-261]
MVSIGFALLTAAILLGCIVLQYWLLRVALRRHEHAISRIETSYPRLHRAAGTQFYCPSCRYYAGSTFLVCALYPKGWPEEQRLCADWRGLRPSTPVPQVPSPTAQQD